MRKSKLRILKSVQDSTLFFFSNNTIKFLKKLLNNNPISYTYIIIIETKIFIS